MKGVIRLSKALNLKITKREQDVLEILWKSDSPLIASDFLKIDSSLSISSVQLALRNLVSKNLIIVDDIVYSGTVLSRSYAPNITKDDFLMLSIAEDLKTFSNKVSAKNLVAMLLEEEENESQIIKDLEDLLAERKKKLKDESLE